MYPVKIQDGMQRSDMCCNVSYIARRSADSLGAGQASFAVHHSHARHLCFRTVMSVRVIMPLAVFFCS